MVFISEVADEGYHLAFRDAPAFIRSVGFEVDHAGQGLAVIGPAASVGNEVIGLSGTRALSWVGEVISTTNQADVIGSVVLLCEVLVGIISAFCGLIMS